MDEEPEAQRGDAVPCKFEPLILQPLSEEKISSVDGQKENHRDLVLGL